MTGALRICLCVFLSMTLASESAKVTPMEKVIALLKDLSAKVTEEGKKEAAEYDKYACFCKEQASDKLYSIEQSEKKIADLKAQIEKLEADIAQLNTEISELSKKISDLEDEIKEKTEKREKEHEEYLVKAKDMDEAITACAAAIKALKDSKKELKGAKLNLKQVTAGLAKVEPSLAQASGATALLMKLTGSAAPKFQYQSNDIIATLEDLLAKFKEMKKDLDNEEFDINSAFEKEKLGLTNEKKFAEKEKAEKETIVEAKTEELETAKTDKDEETKEMNADESFMAVLTKECEEKAAMFDQRSSTRADELKALSEATAELEKGAVPNWEANKKLVGFQKDVTHDKATVSSAPVSFVQIQAVQNEEAQKTAALEQVRKMLYNAAERTESKALSAVVERVILAADHFVKVRGLIKDLIAKLEADAEAEATTKGICDTKMAAAIADRDEANSKIEVAKGKITTLTAKKNELEDEIDSLNKAIAKLKKALLEATELRAEEKAENEKTIAMSEEGAEAVKLALGILQDFYKNAFVQTGKYVPPDSDRDGNTVGDLAPKTFEKDYHGAQSEAKGIVGILEVVLSDFERTNTKTKKDEADSQAAFEEFEKDTNDEIDTKNKRIKEAEGELAETESDILEQEQNLKDAEDLLQSSKDALDDLKAMCVEGEETWEERKKKREEEIEALKEALKILEEWQS